jgi:hypothetical protein
MPTKETIIERIGEQRLIMPILVGRALAANERLTYYLMLLRAAHACAIAPDEPAPNLRVEREASGVTDSSFDRIVEGSSTIGPDTLHIPQVESIVAHLFEELRLMLPPLEVAGLTRPEIHERFEIYRGRYDDLVAHAPLCHDDQLIVGAIAMLTGLTRNSHDTAYQLAIDLHDELDRLQSNVAEEIIDGARVFGVTPADWPLIRAFMKGLNDTAPLKFARPGLDTTVTRDESGLSIQTDLGSTEAHFVVVTVTGLSAMVTYTDIHPRRIRFLHDMLRTYGVRWSAVSASPGADYDVSFGCFTAETPERLERYLTFLGSRLVFLIDWNRARKRLSRLVRKSVATRLLKWAADNKVGHCAFLQVGDVGVIDAALERGAPVHSREGGLEEWLGADSARWFMMDVLRVTSSGLAADRSLSLIEDDIEAALRRPLQTTDLRMLQRVAEDVTIIAALTERVRLTLVSAYSDEPIQDSARTAELAKRWSNHVDQLAVQACRRFDRVSERDVRELLNEADGAADTLEEAAFMLTQLPDSVDPEMLVLLVGVADLVLDSVRQYVRCLEEFRDLSSTSSDSGMDSLLVDIERLVDLHRQAIEKRRALTERLLRGPGDLHDVHVVVNVARGFERTATALARCGALVRDHVLRIQLSEALKKA